MKAEREFISQCAESFVFLERNYEHPITKETVKAIIKERRPKKYRIEEIERMVTKTRIKREVNNMKKVKSINVGVPEIYKMDLDKKAIEMEYLENCKTLREMMTGLDSKISLKERDTTRKEKEGLGKLESIFCEVGKSVSLMHSKGIIHGDLTSSNIMVEMDWSKAYFIDFGLSSIRYS
jgi:Kae1-associated kinase Bud32